MGICDVCNADLAPGEGRRYSAAQFRELADRGFTPPDSMLAIPMASGRSRQEALDLWRTRVVAESETDWALCAACTTGAERYRAAPRTQPAAPVAKKPGFWARLFGGDPGPSGTVEDAWRLLQAGSVDEARAMLLGICRREPRNARAHVMAAFDLMRPPEDRSRGHKLLQAIDPGGDRGDVQSLFVLAGIFNQTADGLEVAIDSLERARQRPPSEPHGAALLLLASVAMSDIRIQQFCRRSGEAITSAMAQPALRGAAQHMLRERRALETFQGGLDAPSDTVAGYEKFFGRPLTAGQKKYVVDQLTADCLIGRGLVLRERRAGADARVAFRDAMRLVDESSAIARALLLVRDGG